ncbi:hypothetical protein GGI22_004424, partial [Coemansia erecta]
MNHPNNDENEYPEFYGASQVPYASDFYSPQMFDNSGQQQIMAPLFNNEIQEYHEYNTPYNNLPLIASGFASSAALSPAIQAGRHQSTAPPLSPQSGARQPNQRQKSRAKTPWTMDENRRLFCAMAEYIHIDQFGIKPLAIYLNPAELNFVEMCETKHQLHDIDIAKSLRERELDTNPNRRSDLLFEVLRHMQDASGNHSTRVVNEKVKNARSRIVNWFMTMFTNGMLPTKRPVRYITAILTSLVASPFCPLEDVLAAPAFAAYVANDAKHDVDLWLQAMFWLYPRKMYAFVYQCAVQVTRAQAEKTPSNARSELDNHLLASHGVAPHPWVVYESLRMLDLRLRSSSGSANGGPRNAIYNELGSADIDDEYQGVGRKRKRRLQVQDSRKALKGLLPSGQLAAASDGVSSYVITSGADVNESLKMFDIMKNEEKIRMAGQRVKLVAAVGGVVRRNHTMSLVDVRYHLYRLWTCVAQFQDVGALFSTKQGFSELVVVHDFMNAFEEANIEPHIRVAPLRIGSIQSVEALVAQYVASTDGEERNEIPMWLAVVAKGNGSHALALLVCSPVIEPPTIKTGSSLISYRQFSDTELASAMTESLITSSGTGESIGGTPVCSIGGLEPWPAPPSATITMSHGQVSQAKIASTVADKETPQLVVSSLFNGFKGVLDPWCEPRILSSMAHARLQELAGKAGNGPSYQELSNDTLALSSSIPEPVAPTRVFMHGSLAHQANDHFADHTQYHNPEMAGGAEYMQFGASDLYDTHVAMSAMATRAQSPTLQAHQLPDASVSAAAAAAAAAAAGLELITPFMSP